MTSRIRDVGASERSYDGFDDDISEHDPTGEYPPLDMPPQDLAVSRDRDLAVARDVGDVVADRYVLRKHLGRGRYGDTYEALDRNSADPRLEAERGVVLHLLSARLSRDPRALSKLEACYHEPHLWVHPNIAKLIGYGSDGREHFAVTELLDGVSLRSVLEDAPGEPLPDDETYAVVRAVGDALGYGHAKGAVHGGIRPDQVFISADYTVKVLDYLPVTAPHTVPYFVEDGESGALAAPDERDDVYGLASLAFELLTGRHPYNGNSPLEAWNARLMLTPIPRIGEQRWLALARALALRRDSRTPTVAKFLADFQIKGTERLRSGKPVLAPEAPSPRRALASDVSIVGDYSSAHPLKRPASLPETVSIAPMAASPAMRQRAGAPDFGVFPEVTVRRALPRPARRRGWRFTTLAVLVVAGIGAAYLSSELVRQRTAQWVSSAHALVASIRSPSRDLPVRNEELPARPAPDAVVPSPAVAEAEEREAAGVIGRDDELEVENVVAPRIVTVSPDRLGQGLGLPPRDEVAALGAEAGDPAGTSRAARGAAAGAGTQLPPLPEPASAGKPEPEVFEFIASLATVSEGQGVVGLTVRRRGGTLGESTIAWWTTAATARPDDDYANLGARIEVFAAGADTHRLFVPIVNDSVAEPTETFYVHVRAGEETGNAAAATGLRQRVEVSIIDDD